MERNYELRYLRLQGINEVVCDLYLNGILIERRLVDSNHSGKSLLDERWDSIVDSSGKPQRVFDEL